MNNVFLFSALMMFGPIVEAVATWYTPPSWFAQFANIRAQKYAYDSTWLFVFMRKNKDHFSVEKTYQFQECLKETDKDCPSLSFELDYGWILETREIMVTIVYTALQGILKEWRFSAFVRVKMFFFSVRIVWEKHSMLG